MLGQLALHSATLPLSGGQKAILITAVCRAWIRGPGSPSSRFIFDALRSIGRNDVAISIATKVGPPSWYSWVARGPGTLWESWAVSESEWTSEGAYALSLNHPMYGGGLQLWMAEVVCGLRVRRGARPGGALMLGDGHCHLTARTTGGGNKDALPPTTTERFVRHAADSSQPTSAVLCGAWMANGRDWQT